MILTNTLYDTNKHCMILINTMYDTNKFVCVCACLPVCVRTYLAFSVADSAWAKVPDLAEKAATAANHSLSES